MQQSGSITPRRDRPETTLQLAQTLLRARAGTNGVGVGKMRHDDQRGYLLVDLSGAPLANAAPLRKIRNHAQAA